MLEAAVHEAPHEALARVMLEAAQACPIMQGATHACSSYVDLNSLPRSKEVTAMGTSVMPLTVNHV
jgi:hypothetical protein